MRYFILILLGYLLYRLLKMAFRFFLSPNRSPVKTNPAGPVIDEMVQDPVCKVYIPRRDAVKKGRNGKDYFFCSPECADKFENQRDGD